MFYGMGWASGRLGKDAVSLSAQGEGRVSNQPFVTVTASRGFGVLQTDGLLGLGFNSLSDGHPTYVETLKQQGVISQALFAVYLSDSEYGADWSARHTSTITFGSYDLSTYTNSQELVRIPLISGEGHWTVPLDAVLVGNTDVLDIASSAIIDTGTSYLLGPYQETQVLLQSLNPSCHKTSEAFFCPCDADLPTITFVLDGRSFPVRPEMYTVKTRGVCLVLIEPVYMQFWVLGDVFIREYYSVFDMDNLEMGFAPVKVNPHAITVNDSGLPYYIWVLILITSFLILILIAWLYLRYLSKHHQPSIQQPLLPNKTS